MERRHRLRQAAEGLEGQRFQRQDLDQATVDQLTTLTRQLQQQSPCVLLIPRPADKLDKPIAVTAWTWLLKLDSFDANAITSFFRQHVNQGPEQVGCALR